MQKRNFHIVKPLTLVVVFVFSLLLVPSRADALVRPGNNLGLLAYWSLEDATGTKATDFSGNGNTGTLSGNAAWMDGKRGKAITLDGTGDNIKTGATPNIENVATFTYAAWAKRDVSGVLDTIIFRGDESSSPDGFRTIRVLVNNRIEACVGANTGSYCSISSNTITDTNWHHYAFTHDLGGDRVIRIYLDGTEVSYNTQGTTVNEIDDDTGQFIYIGSNRTDRASYYFDGLIDEVRIYNRAMTVTQIAALYGSTEATKINANNNSGLAGYWSFEDATGTQATDFSGNRNTGTLVGNTSWANGKRGKALSFDGTGDYTSSTDATSLKFGSGAFSIATWVKAPAVDQISGIVSKGLSNGAMYALGISGTNSLFGSAGKKISIINVNAGVTSYKGIYTTNDVIDGNWHHVVGIWNGSALSIYVDGALASTTVTHDNGGAPDTDNTDPLVIGSFYWSGSHDFTGQIDETRMYNRALLATEVAALYNSGSARVSAPNNLGLVGYWNMEDATGTQATDFSGRGNVGTLNGNTAWVSGPRGKATTFDGTGDLIDLTNDTGFPSGSSSRTISLWIKAPVVGSCRAAFGYGTATGDQLFEVVVIDTGKVGIHWHGNGVEPQFPNSIYTPGVWQQVAFTYDGSDIVSYVNGVQKDTFTKALNTVLSGDSYIGTGGYCSSFDGQVDEVRIYNRVLSPEELLGLYSAAR